ncbi:hypothetical protein FB45DRAFT_1129723 [Roridomyces roridus]|uniref:SAM domain-containing protein n=1 Tax=Roridomyces roridus TaxID=1738132 RepID=A0AAD7F8C1_9AGAR|nr:hypothetical protein FB45DRAFT_1129723 [Roridomyces roridus]
MTGGPGGAGGASANEGGRGGRGGIAQFEAAVVKLTKKLLGFGGKGGTGGEGGNRGGAGGDGATANVSLPLLSEEEIEWLRHNRQDLRQFCEKWGLEDVYLKLAARGYRTVAAVAVVPPEKLMSECDLREGDIAELKVEMQALIRGRNEPMVPAGATSPLGSPTTSADIAENAKAWTRTPLASGTKENDIPEHAVAITESMTLPSDAQMRMANMAFYITGGSGGTGGSATDMGGTGGDGGGTYFTVNNGPTMEIGDPAELLNIFTERNAAHIDRPGTAFASAINEESLSAFDIACTRFNGTSTMLIEGLDLLVEIEAFKFVQGA